MAMSSGGQGQGKMFTDINITPLTDIFLVLLIIMMVIAPSFQNTNNEIKIPPMKAGGAIEDTQVVVEVTKEGAIFLNGQKVASDDALTGQLKTDLSKSNEKALVVRADKETPSRDVLKVFDSASQAGFEKLTIAGEALNSDRAQDLNSGNAPPPQASGEPGAAQPAHVNPAGEDAKEVFHYE